MTWCRIGCTLYCMSIGVYLRVSSHSQKSDSQREEIQHWLNSHGHNLDAVQWFEDIETGSTLDRRGLIALNEAVFSGKVKTIVVWKLDRIARSMKDGINTLSLWCESGVRVVSITQQIDLSGKVGHLVAGVLFGIAEIEHQHIRERQAAGISAAKKRGVYVGRKAGTTKNSPERAKELRKNGLKNKEIAAALGVSIRTVQNYKKLAS